jgi:hypothetical protein
MLPSSFPTLQEIERRAAFLALDLECWPNNGDINKVIGGGFAFSAAQWICSPEGKAFAAEYEKSWRVPPRLAVLVARAGGEVNASATLFARAAELAQDGRPRYVVNSKIGGKSITEIQPEGDIIVVYPSGLASFISADPDHEY